MNTAYCSLYICKFEIIVIVNKFATKDNVCSSTFAFHFSWRISVVSLAAVDIARYLQGSEDRKLVPN